MNLMAYIRSFMAYGHLHANLDPLKLDDVFAEIDLGAKYGHPKKEMRKLIDYNFYGFSEKDLDRSFYVDVPMLGGLLQMKKEWTLRELDEALQKAYCQNIGIEYMHIPDRDQCNWIRDKFELRQYNPLDNETKIHVLDRLLWADGFAQFIGEKFNTMKRFGLEGCESFIPGMKGCMDALIEKGAEKLIIGMPHRGRLNVLANVVHKPLSNIFAEFQGVTPVQDKDAEHMAHSGDVKYHLGTSFTKNYKGQDVTVEVLANPSHLECIDPVVMGKVRADQHYSHDVARKKIVPILIHGDASFSGQGVVYESMQMQDLTNYTVGGTIHVIVNNQIGFTTTPNKGRSAVYATDLAKAINAPIFHVNADCLEDVHYAFYMAGLYRQEFKHDVVIDLIGYRKFGHNELDQPSFTQPFMYQQIAKMTPVARLFEEKLIADGTIDAKKLGNMKKLIRDEMESEYVKSKETKYKAEDWMTKEWASIKNIEEDPEQTGLELSRLKDIGLRITALPEEAEFHRLVKKIFETRHKTIHEGKDIDWGTAEALAFASLIQDGFDVRISGQDVERGTFSHRHAHVFYQDRDGCYIPINNVVPQSAQRRFIASNSHLSEFAVLGYELGYSQANPNTLCLWEAQFGDFANGAQVIIDQFIVSGEAKWNVHNGLVMLLPHGYDGQGPEHSSSRVERYLQLCDQDEFIPNNGNYKNIDEVRKVNMQVVNCSNAANYFHLLRFQMRTPFRKPLCVVAPKKLLRFKGACSKEADFGPNESFKPLITDVNAKAVPKDKVRKVVLCTGQVYYDLEAARAKAGKEDIAILRVERLCPFPFKEIMAELKEYKNATTTWSQEEPKNAGAWLYVEPRLRNIREHLKQTEDIDYAGRPIMGATAVGYAATHNEQLASLVAHAMS